MSLRMAITTKYFKLKEHGNKIIKTIFWYIDNLFGCVGCMGVYSAFINYLVLYRTISLDIIAYSIAGAMISLLLNNLIGK